jgi:uncharacterized surface protein with fasciclin (FAS1) repeats
MKKTLQKSASSLKFLPLLFALLIGLFAVSCSKTDEVVPAEDVEVANLDLYALLNQLNEPAGTDQNEALRSGKAKKPTFRTLTVALAKTGLMGTVASQQLTLFAPTDDAFAALGLNQQNIADVPNLREILLYHAVAGKVYSGDLSNGFVTTLNGAAVEIKLNGGVMVNDANVLVADIKAKNGVIHAIDKVLFPPDKNLLELAKSFAPEFSILVEALEIAGLDGAIANGGPYTVFAPTNAAFVDLLGELKFGSLQEIPVPVLTQVLLYHVVEGRVYSSDLSDGPVPTLNGGTFEVSTSALTLTDFYGREANLIPSLLDVQATNGVVHVIDKVILPDLGL